MRWEYKVVALSGLMTKGFLKGGGQIPESALTEQMNSLGSDGWELVSTFTTAIGYGATNSVALILKRPLA